MKVTDVQFVVVQQPHRGRLVRYDNDTALPAIRFDVDDLTAGRIAYKHDAEVSPDVSEETIDAFGVVAALPQRGKRSEPRTVYVAIAARNVYPPYITNHRMLRVNIGI